MSTVSALASAKLMTTKEIDAINAARIVLKDVQKRCEKLSYEETASGGMSLGKLHEAVDLAGNLVFNVLNTAHNICGVPMTEEQMHLRS